MRFFPHAVKQPLLGNGVKKGKKGKRKIESLSKPQRTKEPVHISLKIIFMVGQRKLSTGRQLQSSRK